MNVDNYNLAKQAILRGYHATEHEKELYQQVAIENSDTKLKDFFPIVLGYRQESDFE